MLDLKKLAQKLDEALAKETKTTLTEWLTSKRSKNIDRYIGDGEFVNIASFEKVSDTSMPLHDVSIYICTQEELPATVDLSYKEYSAAA